MFLWTNGGEQTSWRYLTKENYMSEEKKEVKKKQKEQLVRWFSLYSLSSSESDSDSCVPSQRFAEIIRLVKKLVKGSTGEIFINKQVPFLFWTITHKLRHIGMVNAWDIRHYVWKLFWISFSYQRRIDLFHCKFLLTRKRSKQNFLTRIDNKKWKLKKERKKERKQTLPSWYLAL